MSRFDMPKSESTVWSKIEIFYQKIFGDLLQYIKNSKDSGQKWSMITDEWTDNSNRRYIDLSLHDGSKVYQVALIPAPAGSLTADTIHKTLNDFFINIGINFERDIVGSTNDGASVMVKFGKLIPSLQQLCINHALHLAVVDALYKKSSAEHMEGKF